ncbi:TetR/AcrR family transcriptional regulator [Quadrisphaera oryzae]|uniref:TetR/AcrR family transcriptional regulator n=1 Tax=Quadrisphaera oryzae TaxID=2509661 RepID=UPI0040440FD2
MRLQAGLYAENGQCLQGVGHTDGPQEARRLDLRSADDAQVQETRRRLVAAYRRAAAEQLPRPSVTWLCEAAGVARSTYYTHFATVDDLAVHAITEPFAVVSQLDVEQRSAHRGDRRSISRTGLAHTIEALGRSRDVLAYAIGVGSRSAVLERLIAQFAAFTRPSVDTEFEDLDDDAREVVTQFVSAGAAHVILRWMDSGDQPLEDFIDHLVDVLPARLTAPRAD